MKAYECVQASRSAGRATAKAYIDGMTDVFVEMHGDRRFGDDSAVIAGIGSLCGMPVTIIGIEKGTDTALQGYSDTEKGARTHARTPCIVFGFT